MPPPRKLNPQSVWDTNAVLAAFEEENIKPMHALRMWGWLIRNPSATWHDVPDMPKAAVALLDKYFVKFTTKVVKCQNSSDGSTTKLLVELQDGMQVEAVVMTYDAPSVTAAGAAAAAAARARKRSTLCVSSQVGCQMGCTFCATGTMGLKGHLNAGEIVEQLVHARAVARIRNVVFMGMGEPLNNYEAVRGAVAMMTDSKYFGLRRRHVTVSTVGVIPRIKQLAEDLPGVSLALSLHAPTQELRLQIVPSARAYKLDKLMEAVRSYQANSSQRVFYEYVMLSGVNDGEEQAHQLGQLLKGDDVVINLIPWNPIYQPEGPFFEAPRDGSVGTFQSILRHQYGLHTTIRQEMGQDISGAWGWGKAGWGRAGRGRAG
eukprot:XP_001690026.1 predicted protein [Chlamydomonas reinhardtii]